MSTKNKGKFYINGLRVRLVKFKSSQVEKKLTYLLVFRGRTYFNSDFCLGIFFFAILTNFFEIMHLPLINMYKNFKNDVKQTTADSPR